MNAYIFTIINIFLLSSIISILVIGIILNIKYNEKNIYRQTLISMFAFWAIILTNVFIKYFSEGTPTISYTKDIASIQMIMLGIPCFYSLIGYPIIMMNANLLKHKYWCKHYLPIMIVIAIYFITHLITSTDPFIHYSSIKEFGQNILTLTVLMRIALIVTFIATAIRYIKYIWDIVPIYNDYVLEKIADSRYNVDWVRTLIKHSILVSCLYFTMLFFSSPMVNCLYLISILILFYYIINKSIFYKTSEYIKPIKIRKYLNGMKWVIEDDEIIETNNNTVTLLEIEHWLRDKKPHTNVGFTSHDILEQFPELTQDKLTSLFKAKQENFQSFVRRMRIIDTCMILEKQTGEVSHKQIFARVGFSHYSSFSRSFVALTGISPTDYMNLSSRDRLKIRHNLEEVSTPPPTRITTSN